MAHRQSPKKGQVLLEETREWFLTHSFCTESKITIKSIHSRGNTTREIIHEGHKGMYDAVIMGRQTPSMLEEFFDYSVGNKVIWEEIDFPLWFCKYPHEIPKKDVLLCVDEDAPSQRISDHVGFMLNDNPNHEITMLHVRNPKEKGAIQAEDIFAVSREHLTNNGVEPERIKELLIESDNVAKAIIKHASTQNYAVIAAGRGVHDQTAVRKLFPKSICVKLLQALEGSALWFSR